VSILCDVIETAGEAAGKEVVTVDSDTNSPNFQRGEVIPMWETCAVDLRVRLPVPVAAELEAVQREDPEMVSRMLVYAMTRRTMFNHLSARGSARPSVDR
jgi:hypothetical protein